MSFNRFSRSASDDCEGKGDENETRFSWSYPLFDSLSLPQLAAAGCDRSRNAHCKLLAFSVVQNLDFGPLRRLAKQELAVRSRAERAMPKYAATGLNPARHVDRRGADCVRPRL